MKRQENVSGDRDAAAAFIWKGVKSRCRSGFSRDRPLTVEIAELSADVPVHQIINGINQIAKNRPTIELKRF